MRNVSGMTLVETIVSMSLLTLVTAMIIALFIPSMSLFRRQSGKSDAYRGCLMLLEKFRIGLMNAQLETVTVAPDGKAISWQLVQDGVPFSGTTGDPLMASEFALLFHRPQEERVYYKAHAASTPGPQQPAILSFGDLQAACTPTGSKTNVIGRNITEFSIRDKDGGVAIIEPPLSLTITCVVETKGRETNDEEKLTLTTSVTPRSMRW